MTPNISELIAALPESGDESKATEAAALPAALAKTSLRPIPIGRLSRLTTLGTLQAKIGAAYLFHWLRGWFRNAEANERNLAETHWQTALRLLDSMSYLRGAVMKAGQTLANFPDIAPQQFVDTLQQLHAEAPPMHWSLLSEMVRNELGDDPENVFAEFDKQAFAAASLGQVHRARLKTGEEVAVKIQYPGIARAIQSDFRNFFLFLLPSKLNRDWEYLKDQFNDLRQRLEQETDYELEAANLAKARALFRDADGIAIPRVFPQYSTARVLTMELLDGLHITPFMERGPTQEERNEVARKMMRAWYRMMYSGRMFYADFHPGNFLVLDDGRLGVVDFGFIMMLDDDEWERYRRFDRAQTTGRPEDRVAVVKEWSEIGDNETDRLRVLDEYAQWCWLSRYDGGDFDFGDEADFRLGVDLFMEMIRKRYTRSRPNTPTISRCQFGWRSVFYQLKAKFDIRSIAEEEIKATDWDRSDYA
ncbi:MAG: AarF/ABC1/UbiB kinase family protein [Planctomycetota bacterium]|nr:AarF/ABC1/UbiB kinase family protein [Planctomycetota bacterium]